MTTRSDGLDPDERHLAWFLGPKGENGALLEELVVGVLRDYIHWRRNYFPEDKVVVTGRLRQLLSEETDKAKDEFVAVTAELRRNFPFYSPRYLGHMLSDVTLPSLVGVIAGTLYNPNNVTPEAAPVTVNWEVEASSAMLTMLGYNPPPDPPKERVHEFYEQRKNAVYGWGHITSGGTVANLEALWIARTARYFPLAIKEVAVERGLELQVILPNRKNLDIRHVEDFDLLNIEPDESLSLLRKYLDAVRIRLIEDSIKDENAATTAWNFLRRAQRSLERGTAGLFHDFPPVIFASGASHYSLKKSADVLGIGRFNVRMIAMDKAFRMDVGDLDVQLERSLKEGMIPLSVVGSVGTTEEGAVDPIHEIFDVRKRLERRGASFWLHIDSAWGGFLRSLFSLSDRRYARLVLAKIGGHLQLRDTDSLQEWHASFAAWVRENLVRRTEASRTLDSFSATSSIEEDLDGNRLERVLSAIGDGISSDETGRTYQRSVKRFLRRHSTDLRIDDPEQLLGLSAQDRIELVRDFVSTKLTIEAGHHREDVAITWGPEEVCKAFLAFDRSDSVVVDPHKMGYVPYPCGFVAFRSDRVRHLILERSPYITAFGQSRSIFLPPRHSVPSDNDSLGAPCTRVDIESFGPFILEGSKPGASATSLWLAIRTIPLTIDGHGTIVRASLLGARELYEWLIHWEKVEKEGKPPKDLDFQFLPLTPGAPDTNIVTWVVKKRTSSALITLNALTERVYEELAIQAELGERRYSYSQSFFVSKTTLKPPEYPWGLMEGILKRLGVNPVKDEYESDGLVVLRSAVMNPYLHITTRGGGQDLLREFLQELADAARRGVDWLATRSRR